MNHLEKVARAGHLAKGTVYILSGALALGATIGATSQSSGKLGILKFLEEQTFGKFILAILGLGLICYAIWRFIQTFTDPEKIGDDKTGKAKRVAFFFSGLFYLGLGILAFIEIFRSPGKSGGGGSSFIPAEQQDMVFLIIGVALAIKAAYQFITAFKGDFMEKFHFDTLSDVNIRKWCYRMGYAGHVARGVVISILAYFFIRASMGISRSGGDMKGTSEAFQFIREQSQGVWLLALTAVGLICYGTFMALAARYRQFNV
ncbi:DUF1206 domain-containing protein [Robertkochia aurantiaca]|uniref:DUF1206 domain-containing protein n=1 Tax=Robertkochia aurantiaca TaxID=2873700 RepID=UPI001CCB1886|nr:DUF1206 domain-containing protein [Robertkochia sp. 3YJGBD-33]